MKPMPRWKKMIIDSIAFSFILAGIVLCIWSLLMMISNVVGTRSIDHAPRSIEYGSGGFYETMQSDWGYEVGRKIFK